MWLLVVTNALTHTTYTYVHIQKDRFVYLTLFQLCERATCTGNERIEKVVEEKPQLQVSQRTEEYFFVTS